MKITNNNMTGGRADRIKTRRGGAETSPHVVGSHVPLVPGRIARERERES